MDSFTPHASFNEEVMFGDELDPIVKQHTLSYWNNDQLFPTDIEALQPKPENQTYVSSEGEQPVPSLAAQRATSDDVTSKPSREEYIPLQISDEIEDHTLASPIEQRGELAPPPPPFEQQ